MNKSFLNLYRTRPSAESAGQPRSLDHPDDVANDPRLSLEEKRTLLASWASDAHAVEDSPTLRQLDSGAIVSLNEILRAIEQLDSDEPDPVRQTKAWGFPSARRHLPLNGRRSKIDRRHGFDDDDDPPPSPVLAAVPRRKHPFVTLGQRLCRA